MPPRLNEVSVHPILTAPGDIKKAEKTRPGRARNHRHNVGGVPQTFQIGRDDIHLGDMRVTMGAQRGGEVPSRDISLWRPQLTARVIPRN